MAPQWPRIEIDGNRYNGRKRKKSKNPHERLQFVSYISTFFPLATLKKRVLPKLDAQKQDELASK